MYDKRLLDSQELPNPIRRQPNPFARQSGAVLSYNV